MRSLLVAILALSLMGCMTWVERDGTQGSTGERLEWVLEADRAVELVAAGALVLDARPDGLREASPLEGAPPIPWQLISRQEADARGLLLDDLDLVARELQGLGVRADTDVVVIGDPLGGWGEAGRIAWSLRVLGHERASIVDGGYDAFVAAGGVGAMPGASSAPGDFVPSPSDELVITAEQIEAGLSDDSLALVDTRELREYDGETPYGEQRGGHVPGSVHLYFKDVLDADGFILPDDELVAKLSALGVERDDDVVAYCTGGVRSAFVVFALKAAGFERVRNYAGSMWEWSSTDRALE